MFRILFCFVTVSFFLFADQNITEYLNFYKKHKNLLGSSGASSKGEIEILLEPSKIKQCQEQSKNQLLKKGMSNENAESWSQIGIIHEDSYWIWIRDAVLFPSGAYGTYNRILTKSTFSTGTAGVAILALINNRITLNVEYRHATRNFELELPRGAIHEGETVKEAAKRELQEETGMIIQEVNLLGELSPDAGVLGAVIPIYYGMIVNKGKAHQEESEAIYSILTLSKDELKNAFKQGFIEIKIAGKNRKILCRDAFLAFALLQAELQGIL